jgi:hypothetical protein
MADIPVVGQPNTFQPNPNNFQPNPNNFGNGAWNQNPQMSSGNSGQVRFNF